MRPSSTALERAMERIKRRRLGVSEWRAILGRFSGSGLTVGAFCKQESVSAASFYHWRSKLSGSQARPSAASQSRAKFVDLGVLRAPQAGGASVVPQGGFELRLDLGGGLQLHLVRS